MSDEHQPAGIPSGIWLNVGSGASDASDWSHLDASWQCRLAKRPVLAWVGSKLTGKKVGTWPKEVAYCDVRRGLPFADESVAVVYSSHTVEHMYRSDAVSLLQEARRVLLPGGVCRVVVPDVASIVRWYLEHRETEPRPEKPSSDLFMEMLGMRQAAPADGLIGWYRRWTGLDDHKWMYDVEGLTSLFVEAGFPVPAARGYLESAIPAERLTRVEKADRIVDGAGACVESRKRQR